MSVRVRFAPSPTGFLHVGSARAALYNWLFAKRHGGRFILRSDDTDQERSTAEYQADIVDGLRWLGLDWDEGIEVGGPHEPYRQSLRMDRYRTVAQSMLDDGSSYPCFCTPEELQTRREEAQAEGRPPGYDGRCRSIDPSEAADRRKTEEAALRFEVRRPGETVFEDAVRGEVRFDHDNIDDFVILRSDGSPTYHLASSVDDVDFGITHVVRGEDLLSSTPKHIMISTALGADPAQYAHLPLLHGPDGKKLSKRHGDTALHAYIEAGVLPEAMVNYLALLGWSPGVDETIVPLEQMVERFDLSDVSKNAAIFDPAKLEWMNGAYIRALDPGEFVKRTTELVQADLGRELGAEEQQAFTTLGPAIQERAKTLLEVAPQVRFMFVDELDYDEGSWDKVMSTPEAATALRSAAKVLGELREWSTPSIESSLRTMLEDLGLSATKGLQPIRVALTGSSVSPPLFESLEVVGMERSIARIEAALARL
ncbi:MAG: glutamate--tRNA ligase [Acidimicrobiia bacterium]|nr:glutamate--tRNA ligase [Acidimicrobiia bacterium]